MSETAIVIEDDPSVNESLSELLEIMEIKVMGRGFDGKEGVELFNKYNPDYSFIDLSMPYFDGFYAIENIRKQNKDAKVFAVTGDVTLESKQKLVKLGVNGIIYKPYSLNVLLETIQKKDIFQFNQKL